MQSVDHINVCIKIISVTTVWKLITGTTDNINASEQGLTSATARLIFIPLQTWLALTVTPPNNCKFVC
jgi:hypothetical protein